MGNRVQALAKVVKDVAWARSQFPNSHETTLLFGRVTARQRPRSVVVSWDGDVGNTVIATRLLQRSDDPSPAAASGGRGRGQGRGRGRGRGRGHGRGRGRGRENTATVVATGIDDDDFNELEEIDSGAFEPFEEQAAANPGDNDLCPHGLDWIPQDEHITMEEPNVAMMKSRIKWGDDLGHQRSITRPHSLTRRNKNSSCLSIL